MQDDIYINPYNIIIINFEKKNSTNNFIIIISAQCIVGNCNKIFGDVAGAKNEIISRKKANNVALKNIDAPICL